MVVLLLVVIGGADGGAVDGGAVVAVAVVVGAVTVSVGATAPVLPLCMHQHL